MCGCTLEAQAGFTGLASGYDGRHPGPHTPLAWMPLHTSNILGSSQATPSTSGETCECHTALPCCNEHRVT